MGEREERRAVRVARSKRTSNSFFLTFPFSVAVTFPFPVGLSTLLQVKGSFRGTHVTTCAAHASVVNQLRVLYYGAQGHDIPISAARLAGFCACVRRSASGRAFKSRGGNGGDREIGRERQSAGPCVPHVRQY